MLKTVKTAWQQIGTVFGSFVFFDFLVLLVLLWPRDATAQRPVREGVGYLS